MLCRKIAAMMLGAVGGLASAEDPQPPLSLPIPESPAASAIGAESTPVLRPSSAREFAVSLAFLADRRDKLKPGISTEISPWLMFIGAKDVATYGHSVDPASSAAAGRTVWKRHLSFIPDFNPIWTAVNTTLSVATGLKTSGSADRADKIAVGLKLPWFDEGDPRIDLAFWNCWKADAVPPPLPPAPIGDKPKTEVLEANKTLLEACRTKARQKNAFASSAGFAFAQTWRDNGTDQDPKIVRAGRNAWFSYTGNFGEAVNARPLALTLQAKLIRNELDPSPPDGVTGSNIAHFNGDAYALRLRSGSGDTNFDLSASIESRRFTDGRNTRTRIGALGIEFLVGEVWVKVTTGVERGEKNDGSRAFVSTSFNMSKETSPSLCVFGISTTNPKECKTRP